MIPSTFKSQKTTNPFQRQKHVHLLIPLTKLNPNGKITGTKTKHSKRISHLTHRSPNSMYSICFLTQGINFSNTFHSHIFGFSGSGLHVGHPEGYTATDIIARFKRANGYNVLHPMGWDAFGLPAEQYALQVSNICLRKNFCLDKHTSQNNDTKEHRSIQRSTSITWILL